MSNEVDLFGNPSRNKLNDRIYLRTFLKQQKFQIMTLLKSKHQIQHSLSFFTFTGIAIIMLVFFQTTSFATTEHLSAWMSSNFEGDHSVDAVLNYEDINKKIYFFKDDQYIRYDIDEKRMDAGYPKSITAHWGLTGEFSSNLDAVVRKGQYVYFFKGNQYVRYDRSISAVSPGYPKAIYPNWSLPAGFRSDIDAIFNKENGYIYFFKKDKYVRFNVADNRADSGYPANSQVWRLGSFIDSPQAAVKKGNYAYFFKNNEYVRFNLPDDAPSANYPKNTKNLWRLDWAPGYTPADLDREGFENNYLTRALTFKNIAGNQLEIFINGIYVDTINAGATKRYEVKKWDNITFVRTDAPVSTNTPGVAPIRINHDLFETTKPILISSKATFSQAKSGNETFGEYTANLYSYDFARVDLFRLNNSSSSENGARKRVFKKLSASEDTYFYNDFQNDNRDETIIGESYFKYISRNESRAELQTTLHASERDFMQSWGLDVKVGVGEADMFTGDRPGGGSISQNHMWATNSSGTQAYGTTEAKANIYEIQLLDQKENIQLEEAFVDSVSQLPNMNGEELTMQKAKKSPAWGVYQQFIQTWGTHFPQKVSYGGRYFQMRRFSENSIEQLSSSSWAATGKGGGSILEIEATFRQESSQRLKNMVSQESVISVSQGGQLSSDGSWVAEKQNAEPVDMTLVSLSNLLYEEILKNGMKESDLSGRRKMLELVIQDYINKNNWTPEANLPPRLYMLEIANLKIDDVYCCTADEKLWGFITAKSTSGKSVPFFDRYGQDKFEIIEGGNYQYAAWKSSSNGYTYKTSNHLMVSVPPHLDLTKEKFYLKMSLKSKEDKLIYSNNRLNLKKLSDISRKSGSGGGLITKKFTAPAVKDRVEFTLTFYATELPFYWLQAGNSGTSAGR